MKVELTGLAELNASLRALAEDTTAGTAKAAMRRGVTKAAQILVESARRKVPVRTGNLRDSIVASTKLINETGKAEYAAVLAQGGSQGDAVAALRSARRAASGGGTRVTVYIGPDNQPQAYAQEFGTIHLAPVAYMRRALDETGQDVLQAVQSEVSTQVTLAANRAAKRRAKTGK